MTIVQPLQTMAPELLEKYPTLLRMGHRFETSIGQRLIVDGFYGAMDFVFGGDGDGFSIGGNHLNHAARKNVNLSYVVMDNFVYGLTKNQTSPSMEWPNRSTAIMIHRWRYGFQ